MTGISNFNNTSVGICFEIFFFLNRNLKKKEGKIAEVKKRIVRTMGYGGGMMEVLLTKGFTTFFRFLSHDYTDRTITESHSWKSPILT